MLGHNPPPYDDSDEEGDDAAVAALLQRPAFDDAPLPAAPTIPPPTPPSGRSSQQPARSPRPSSRPSEGSILHATLLDAQAELEQTRAIVGAARLRSVLRSMYINNALVQNNKSLDHGFYFKQNISSI